MSAHGFSVVSYKTGIGNTFGINFLEFLISSCTNFGVLRNHCHHVHDWLKSISCHWSIHTRKLATLVIFDTQCQPVSTAKTRYHVYVFVRIHLKYVGQWFCSRPLQHTYMRYVRVCFHSQKMCFVVKRRPCMKYSVLFFPSMY